MKTKTFLLLFATTIIIFSCAPKTTINKDMALADSLLKINESAYNSGDAKVVANLFTDDALVIGPMGKRTWGKDSIYASFKTMAPAIKNFKAYLGPATVTENRIQMQKYFTADIVIGNATLKGKGTAYIVWEKQADKTWKEVFEIEDYDIK
jgi:uncharacterized protein (TIGR02246 family)